jgi:gliding motility-associated-like protein
MNKRLFLLVVFVFLSLLAKTAERPPQTRWTFKNPFEQKVFIENKGQYFLKGKAAKEQILFGARQDGLQYFFTADGIWIKYIDKVERSKREIEKFEHSIGEENDKEGEEKVDNVAKYKWVERFYRMEFKGAGNGTVLVPEQEVAQLYNFCPDNKTNLSAHAWKKITYRDLYPGIDMEFYFPEDKQGFKYNLIIHPGADPNQIRIKYPENGGITVTHEGNVQISSLFGDFTDHAPVANEAQTGKPVDCSFQLSKEIVSFNLGEYDKSKGLIIDPWTTTPSFAVGSNAYDVDWDNAGNCYAYGGSSPFQVIKFNSSGAMLWAATLTFGYGYYYGDFAVDRNSGSIYVTDGFNSSGAQVIKLNQAGGQAGMFYGNSNFAEMWRIVFSRCTNQAVIAGGGTSTPSYTGCYLDTSLINMNPVDVIHAGNSSLHDMWGITIDAFGSAYFATAKTQYGTPGFDNIIYKVPTPALTPITWQVSEGYSFIEVASVNYAPGPPNGFNGMTMSNTNLYSYDSYVLKKWNSSNGSLVASVNVNGSSTSSMTYGGLTSDECDNLFVGVNSQIWQYNSGLSHTNTISKAGTVYDVNLGKNNILYSCGAGFVSADQLSLLPCSILNTTDNIVNPNCSQPTGSATVTVNGGTSPYSITWNTTPPQTGTVATNLPPGTYIATITDNSCIKQTTYDTVTITTSGSLPNLTVTSGTICSGGSIALTASGASTYTWSPSTGLNTNTGASVTASPTITTTYTVTGSQSGCNGTTTSTVTVHALPVVTVSSATVCAGISGTMNASGASTYTWSSGGTGASLSVSPPSTTSYTITGTDVNGCVSSGTATITVNALPVVTATSASVCPGGTATLTASGASTYTWSTGATTASMSAAPSTNTTYTVNANDINGCGGSATASITINSNLSVNATNNGPLCAGGTLSFSASTGVTWSWTGPGGFTSGNQNPSVTNAAPASSGVYSVTATDANGCFGSATTTVTINPLPVPAASSNSPLCANQTLNLSASGGSTYSWTGPNAFSSAQQNPSLASVTTAASGSYTVLVTDANNCTASTTVGVQVNPLPVVTVNGATVCANGTINLSATGGVSYSWSGPNSYVSNQQNPSITNATTSMSGAYAVTVTDANGCVNGNVAQVTVNPALVISAGNNSPICVGSILSFTCNAGVSWNWSGPGAFTSTQQNPTLTNAQLGATGTYSVNAVDANGCAGSATTNVTINPLPTPAASNNSPVCANQTITFTGSGGNIYAWTGPGAFTSSQQNPSITTATTTMSGTYTLTVIDNNNCMSSTTTQVLVNPLPVITVNSSTICLGNSASLSAAGAANYSWSPSAGLSTTTGANVVASPIASTIYLVTGVDNNLCVNVASSTVTVNQLPVISLSTTNICAGNFGTMTAAGAVTYNWSPATGLNSTSGSTVQANPSSTTSYTVTGTDANGCSNTSAAVLTVNPLPVLAINPQTASGCAPLCVTFSNTTSASGTCSWIFGDGTNSSACAPTHCFNGIGTFNAALTLTDANGCTNSTSTSVVVYPVPNADFNATPQPTSILDPGIHFTDLTTGAILAGWHWSFGESGATSSQQDPSHIYQAPGSYPVTLVVTSNYGCVDSITKIIKIDEDFTIYVPTAFSPNDDGTNDVFYAKGEGVKDFKMFIYDRWGELIFYSEDIFKGWDGSFRAKGDEILQEDVYVWKVEVKSYRGESKALQGTVSLLK